MIQPVTRFVQFFLYSSRHLWSYQEDQWSLVQHSWVQQDPPQMGYQQAPAGVISTAAIANGGGVATGSLVAVLQSADKHYNSLAERLLDTCEDTIF